MSFIKIAPYSPDNAILNNQNSSFVKNVLVGQGCYIPMPSLEKMSKVSPGKILGSIALNVAGKPKIFVGLEDKLLLLDSISQGWQDVSAHGIKYSACKEALWSFAVFGKYVIAVNANDDPQFFEIGHSKRFKPLGGKPPRAGMVKIWGDFVCLLQLPDMPNRVFWSGLNNVEFWTPGQHGCDYQDFPEGGAVKNSSQDSNPVIFLENAIYYGQFIPGSDIVFSFKKIHDNQGVKFPRSVVARGQNIFYVDKKGFFQITAAGDNIPIGYERVNASFFEKVVHSKDHSMISNIEAVIDPYASRVYWAIDYLGQGTFTELLIYDWMLDAWSRVEIKLSWILPIYSLGLSLEDLDKICDNIDKFPYSFDDLRWNGGQPLLAAFDENGYLSSFTGAPMQAIVESQEFLTSDGSLQRLSSIYPLIDSKDFSLEILKRNNLQEAPRIVKSHHLASNSGRISTYVRGRYLRLRLSIEQGAQWSHIRGFDIDLNIAGKR